jgi:hypothetical protein
MTQNGQRVREETTSLVGVWSDQFQSSGNALISPFDGPELVHRNIDCTRHVSGLDNIIESALQVGRRLHQMRPFKGSGLCPGQSKVQVRGVAVYVLTLFG